MLPKMMTEITLMARSTSTIARACVLRRAIQRRQDEYADALDRAQIRPE